MLFDYLKDVEASYGKSTISTLIKSVLINPSTQACLLIRLSLSTGILGYYFFRHILIWKHSIDIGKGAMVGAGLYLPHPINIVIGKGVVIAQNVTIYQGVTLGKSQGRYPIIGRGTVIFPNSVLVGGVSIAENSRISALTFMRFENE